MDKPKSLHSISDPVFDDLLRSQAQDRSSLWSISWADIMMTMFILFAVLYLYQIHERDFQYSPSAPDLSHTETTLESDDMISPTRIPAKPVTVSDTAVMDNLQKGTLIELAEDTAVRFALPGDLLFDLGKAEIRHEAEQQLEQIATLLKSNDYVVNVVGHTDNIPSTSSTYPSNWELSTARACRVARYLISVSGLSENRFFVSGHSQLKPLRPHTSAYNRSLNRRVEIILMKEMPYANPFAQY